MSRTSARAKRYNPAAGESLAFWISRRVDTRAAQRILRRGRAAAPADGRPDFIWGRVRQTHAALMTMDLRTLYVGPRIACRDSSRSRPRLDQQTNRKPGQLTRALQFRRRGNLVRAKLASGSFNCVAATGFFPGRLWLCRRRAVVPCRVEYHPCGSSCLFVAPPNARARRSRFQPVWAPAIPRSRFRKFSARTPNLSMTNVNRKHDRRARFEPPAKAARNTGRGETSCRRASRHGDNHSAERRLPSLCREYHRLALKRSIAADRESKPRLLNRRFARMRISFAKSLVRI